MQPDLVALQNSELDHKQNTRNVNFKKFFPSIFLKVRIFHSEKVLGKCLIGRYLKGQVVSFQS